MMFNRMKGMFAGEDCLVVAPGPSSRSLDMIPYYMNRWVIGCNRAVVYCQPDLAVCAEPFRDPCWPIMRSSQAMMVFSHICKDRLGNQPHPRIVKVPGKNVKEWFDPRNPDPPLTGSMSPFWATAVAAWLGFDNIGLAGVDLTADRYHEVWRINDTWEQLLKIIETPVINFSPTSRLTAVPMGARDSIRPKGMVTIK